MQKWESRSVDVLVIGAGFGGCRAAIEAHDLGASVMLITQGPLVGSGSSFHPILLAHGRGYSAGLNLYGPGDTPEALLKDMLQVGQGMADEDLARILVEEAPARLRDLEDYGVIFTRKSNAMSKDVPDHGSGVRGVLALHPQNLRQTFRQQVHNRNIAVLDRCQVFALLGELGRCAGAMIADYKGNVLVAQAKSVILASGGPNDLFLHNLNTPDLNGACHDMALELGAELINIEFFQIILGMTHPLKAPFPEAYLASAPRIVNGRGEAFLGNYLSPGEDETEVIKARARTGPFHWAGRGRNFDIALAEEMRAGRGARHGGIVADFSGVHSLELHMTAAVAWSKWAAAHGIDVLKSPVEIAPCAHACNGGVYVDACGASKVVNLWACGEAAGGPHGANRVGGNQFSGSQVFAVRSARSAVDWARDSDWSSLDQNQIDQRMEQLESLLRRDNGVSVMEVRRQLQDTMWQHAMLDRCETGLRVAQAKLQEIEETQIPLVAIKSPGQLAIGLGLPHALRMAQMILEVAYLRQESRGPHYRTDFAYKNEEDFGLPIIVERADNPQGFSCRLTNINQS